MKRRVNLALIILALALAAAPLNAADGKTKTEAVAEDAPDSGAESDEQAGEAESEDDLADYLSDYEDEYADDEAAIADPVKWWNVAWFKFNDKLYFWILKPGGKGWGKILPKKTRNGFKNFFVNLAFPKRFFNSAFQGRFKKSGSELGAFLLNTTVGVLGFGDPAGKWFDWKPEDRDFDQTLGKGHLGKGFFLTWPFLGPSSIRGTFGQIMDLALNLATYIPGSTIIKGMNDVSLDIHPYESLREMALDPYIALRDAYVQNRNKKIEE